jgi:thiamine biosynthesis protein ThiC
VKAKKPNRALVNKIRSIADKVADSITTNFAKSSYTSDLRKDLEQDLWVEYYTTKSNMPDLSDKEILDSVRSNVNDLSSVPQPHISYRGSVSNSADLPDDFAEAGGQIYRKSSK